MRAVEDVRFGPKANTGYTVNVLQARAATLLAAMLDGCLINAILYGCFKCL